MILIPGCVLNCNYGDTCGASTPYSGLQITIVNPADPWVINAKNMVVPGYAEQNLCLHCISNNAVAPY